MSSHSNSPCFIHNPRELQKKTVKMAFDMLTLSDFSLFCVRKLAFDPCDADDVEFNNLKK